MSDVKKAIVNLSTISYNKGKLRMIESLKNNFDGDILIFDNEFSVGSPIHDENPYAFKIYAIEKALLKGYNQILWLDASVYAIKDVSPLFDIIKINGLFMEDSKFYVGDWCNEYTLDYFKINRSQASNIPMFSGGFIGFDFTNKMAIEFFDNWKNSMIAGCFKGNWSNHRHDMTCGSIIAHQMGIIDNYVECGNFFSNANTNINNQKETVIFHLESAI